MCGCFFLHYCFNIAEVYVLYSVVFQCLLWDWFFLVLCAAKLHRTFKKTIYRHTTDHCDEEESLRSRLFYVSWGINTYCFQSAPPTAPAGWRGTERALPSSSAGQYVFWSEFKVCLWGLYTMRWKWQISPQIKEVSFLETTLYLGQDGSMACSGHLPQWGNKTPITHVMLSWQIFWKLYCWNVSLFIYIYV